MPSICGMLMSTISRSAGATSSFSSASSAVQRLVDLEARALQDRR